MSESNIYKDHYDLQKAYGELSQSVQNIYMTLYPLVAPDGVQLTLQEVIDLTVQNLSRVQGEVSDEVSEEKATPKKGVKKTSE